LDWSELISQFLPISSGDVPAFAPQWEMEQAVAAYNRAIANIGRDSADIALIALRKLSSSYPRFSRAALLYAYCLAGSGHFTAAKKQLQNALETGLPDDLRFEALEAQKKIERQIARQNQAKAAGSRLSALAPARGRKKSINPRTAVPAGTILQKTGHRARVRIASEKERQSVIRQGDLPEQEMTRVQVRRQPVEILRIAMPGLAGLIVLGLLIYAGITWLPGEIERGRERRQAQTRLEWLISQLEQLSGQDPRILDILKNYQGQFNPTPTILPEKIETPTPAATSSQQAPGESTSKSESAASPDPAGSSIVQTSLSTTTSPVTAADQVEIDLQQAEKHYQLALAIQGADLMAAADHLLEARHLLSSIPSDTKAPDVSGTASAVSTSVEKLISGLAKTAAGQFWQLGQIEYQAADYQEALVYHLKAFELYPGYYTGGGAYYCGRCYQLLGDYQAARPYYQYVIDHYSGREIADYAAARLKEMGY
jgi:tetratricopeptide (TPR) repeat protein